MLLEEIRQNPNKINWASPVKSLISRYGFLNAVTRRKAPDGLLTKNEGFKFSAVIPKSSGRLNTP